MALSFVPSSFSRQPGFAGLPGHFPDTTAAKVALPLQLTVAMTTVKRDPVAGEIIDAAIEVHRLLGPGLLESAYQGCLVFELTSRGLRVARQVALPVTFKEVRIDCGYRLDLVVEDTIIVEVKNVERLLPIHTAQVLTYLRLTGARQALLLNFNGLTLKEGLKSFLSPGNVASQPQDRGER